MLSLSLSHTRAHFCVLTARFQKGSQWVKCTQMQGHAEWWAERSWWVPRFMWIYKELREEWQTPAVCSRWVFPSLSFIRLAHHQASLLWLNIDVRSACDLSKLFRLRFFFSHLATTVAHFKLKRTKQNISSSGCLFSSHVFNGLQDADSSVYWAASALAANICWPAGGCHSAQHNSEKPVSWACKVQLLVHLVAGDVVYGPIGGQRDCKKCSGGSLQHPNKHWTT